MHSCARYEAYLSAEQVWQVGYQVLAPESVAKIVPEFDILFLAGLDQTGERITTSPPIFRARTAADLAFDDISSNIVFTAVVVQRNIRALQHQQ